MPFSPALAAINILDHPAYAALYDKFISACNPFRHPPFLKFSVNITCEEYETLVNLTKTKINQTTILSLKRDYEALLEELENQRPCICK